MLHVEMRGKHNGLALHLRGRLFAALCAAFLLCTLGSASRARGEGRESFGPSRAISHALSASRDTGIFGWAYLPRQVRVAGVDVALVTRGGPARTLRLGFFGLIEISGADNDDAPFFGSGQSVDLWRAAYGVSAALSFDEVAERWFGERGRFELTVSLRHESDHITGDESGDTEPQFELVPNIGDFVMPDVAVRIPWGHVDADFRIQHKIFVSGNSSGYTHGPGGDFILRWRTSDRLHFFASTFAEYLFGNTVNDYGHEVRVPDSYVVRQLVGVILPGFGGDLQLFTSLRAGHGKGKMVFTEELAWGWGMRLNLLAPFE